MNNSFEHNSDSSQDVYEKKISPELYKKGRKLLYTWLLGAGLFLNTTTSEGQTSLEIKNDTTELHTTNEIKELNEKIKALFISISEEAVEKGLLKNSTNGESGGFYFSGKVNDLEIDVDYNSRTEGKKSTVGPKVSIHLERNETEKLDITNNPSSNEHLALVYDWKSGKSIDGGEDITYENFAKTYHFIIPDLYGHNDQKISKKELTPKEEFTALNEVKKNVDQAKEDSIAIDSNTNNLLELKKMMDKKEELPRTLLVIDSLQKKIRNILNEHQNLFVTKKDSIDQQLHTQNFSIKSVFDGKAYMIEGAVNGEQCFITFDTRGRVNVSGKGVRDPFEELDLLKKFEKEVKEIK